MVTVSISPKSTAFAVHVYMLLMVLLLSERTAFVLAIEPLRVVQLYVILDTESLFTTALHSTDLPVEFTKTWSFSVGLVIIKATK